MHPLEPLLPPAHSPLLVAHDNFFHRDSQPDMTEV